MEVNCPRHKKSLQIEHTMLSVLSVSYPVVVGTCPICGQRYINRNLLFSSGIIKIDGISYEYLGDMEKSYPPPIEANAMSSQSRNSESKKEKTNTAPIPPVPEPVKKPDMKPAPAQSPNLAENLKAIPYKEKKKEENGAEQKQAVSRKKMKKLQREQFEISRNNDSVYFPKSYFIFDKEDLPQQCPNDKFVLEEVKILSVSINGKSYRSSGYYCRQCRVAYFSRGDVPELVAMKKKRSQILESRINKTSPEVFAQKKNSEKTPEKRATEIKRMTGSDRSYKDRFGKVNFATNENVLYVCKGIILCKKNGHNVSSATGALFVKERAVITINTNYCPDCKKYFISYDEYTKYRQIYGSLLGNIVVSSGSFNFFDGNLADESILRVCGYSVNQTENLSAEERRYILSYLIDSRISSKPEIIEYLSYFIRRNGKKANMEEAVARWNDDLQWVRNYQIDRQRVFEIKEIIRNR